MQIQYFQLIGQIGKTLGKGKPFLLRHIRTENFYSDTKFDFKNNKFISTKLYFDHIFNGCEGVDYKELTFQEFLSIIKQYKQDYSPALYYIELAKIVCKEAHKGQVDKAGVDYYLHPYTVADNLIKAGVKDADYLAAAYLHDVLEDTAITEQDLYKFGFNSNIVNAVKLLTHNKADDYYHYLDKVITNPIALTVKKFDLAHNMDPTRSASSSPHLQEKYTNAINYIKGKSLW